MEAQVQAHALVDPPSCEAFLSANGIAYKIVQHEPVMTMPEMKEKVSFAGHGEPFEQATLIKNLFLQNSKKKEQLWLVIATINTEIDMKALTKYLKVGSGNLRGGNADTLKEVLGAQGGSVTVLGIVNDKENKVKLLVDKAIFDSSVAVAFHPMINTHTLAFSVEDLKKLISLSGHKEEVIDFSTLTKDVEDSAKREEEEKKAKQGGAKGGKKGGKNEEEKKEDVHQLGIEYTKEENFSKWYQQIITKSEMIEYYEISGCYILRPSAYFIWEQIQNFLDAKFKTLGVSNCYFPMFVSERALSKEKAHVEGFAPEVAWVTRSGKSDLAEPIAIRPTSETIMYPSFAKWTKSHRDLPLLLNQWTNVVRWEFKHPTPFIRTREFLWQEGHTAHATTDEAGQFVLSILDFYHDCYKEVLAIPSIKGRKSEEEKFAGAHYTTTVELYVPGNGRGIQGATSHHLGQNFAKMFDVWFENAQKQKEFCHQTSWGYSTRSIGSMILIHSDNKGLVLPPRAAQYQVVIIPIIQKDADINAILGKAEELFKTLKQNGIRCTLDDRDNYNPGWKFNNWELKGVPIRMELGSKDLAAGEVKIVRRDTGNKKQLKWENMAENIKEELEQMHHEMYEKAKTARDSHLKRADSWEQFMTALNEKNLCLTPWCNTSECELEVKNKSKVESMKVMAEAGEEEEVLTGAAKTLCIPFDQSNLGEGKKCFSCGQDAKVEALWGRTY